MSKLWRIEAEVSYRTVHYVTAPNKAEAIEKLGLYIEQAHYEDVADDVQVIARKTEEIKVVP